MREDGVLSSLVPRLASSLALMYSAGLSRAPPKHRPRLTPDIPPGANGPPPTRVPLEQVAPSAAVPPLARRHPPLLPRHSASPTPPWARPPPPIGCSRFTPCLGAGRVQGARGRRAEAPDLYPPPPGADGSSPPCSLPIHVVPRLSAAAAPSMAPRSRSLLTQLRISRATLLAPLPPRHPRLPRSSCHSTVRLSTVYCSPGCTASYSPESATSARRRRSGQAPLCQPDPAKISA